MPTQCVADWELVKTLAVALGSIKAACDKLGVSYAAARQRAVRESWPVATRPFKAVQAAKLAVVDQITRQTGFVTPVTNTAETLSQILADDEHATRIHLSKAAKLRAIHHAKVAESKPELVDSQSLKSDAQTAGIVHRWSETGQGNRTDVAIQVNIG